MPTANEDIDDIEDLVAPGDLMPSDRYNNKKDVIYRGKKSKISGENSETKLENHQENGSVSNYEIFL